MSNMKYGYSENYGLSIGTDIGDLEWPLRRKSPYFALFHRIRLRHSSSRQIRCLPPKRDIQLTGRLRSTKDVHSLPVVLFYIDCPQNIVSQLVIIGQNWLTLQRGLSAIAELLVLVVGVSLLNRRTSSIMRLIAIVVSYRKMAFNICELTSISR